MSVTVTDSVLRFHRRIGAPIASIEPTDMRRLFTRFGFITEEVAELRQAIVDRNAVDILDALVDLTYVAVGTAVELGFDFDEAFARVHVSNMTKEPAGNGKGIKGDAYVPPDLRDLIPNPAP